MQEEIEQRTITLVISCAKLTGKELEKALSKLHTQMKSGKRQPDIRHGKMTVKELAAQNKGMQSIEVTNDNIGSFNRVASKYGIDFAPFKVKGEKRYLVFFKAPDTDAMTAAFKEYTEKQLTKGARPSVLGKLRQIAARMNDLSQHKVKDKELER